MRVLIADDSALIRDGLAQVLPAHGFEVAGTVADLPALLAAVPRDRTGRRADRHPDAADLHRRRHPGRNDDSQPVSHRRRHRALPARRRRLRAHAPHHDPARTGYLLKDRITEMAVLAAAIERVCRGETVLDPELVDLLLHRPTMYSRLEELTAREREVLALLAQGLTDRGIADRLWLTPKTVETHVRHILRKLNLPTDTLYNRRVLAVLAYMREDGVTDTR